MTSSRPTKLEAPRGAMLIAGLSERYTDATRHRIPPQWQRLAPRLGAIPGQVGRAAYAVSSLGDDGFEYLAGVEVTSRSGLPGEFRHIGIPARRYAVFSLRGHVSEIPEACAAIGDQWLPRSGHEPAGPPELIERYGEAFDPPRGTGDIEIWIPIKD